MTKPQLTPTQGILVAIDIGKTPQRDPDQDPRPRAPAVEELEEGDLVRSELFERLTRDPRDDPRHQLARLAHLDHRDDRMILVQSGEALVQVSWLWHGAAPSVAQRRWCIASPPAP